MSVRIGLIKTLSVASHITSIKFPISLRPTSERPMENSAAGPTAAAIRSR
jgi:hypothetical protein